MATHWPVIYSALAVALILSLALFVSLKLEMRKLQARVETQDQEGNAWREESERSLRSLAARLDDVQSQISQAPANRPRFNPSTRAQALRMARRGDDVDRIATALSISRPEVELLLKVNRQLEEALLGA